MRSASKTLSSRTLEISMDVAKKVRRFVVSRVTDTFEKVWVEKNPEILLFRVNTHGSQIDFFKDLMGKDEAAGGGRGHLRATRPTATAAASAASKHPDYFTAAWRHPGHFARRRGQDWKLLWILVCELGYTVSTCASLSKTVEDVLQKSVSTPLFLNCANKHSFITCYFSCAFPLLAMQSFLLVKRS